MLLFILLAIAVATLIAFKIYQSQYKGKKSNTVDPASNPLPILDEEPLGYETSSLAPLSLDQPVVIKDVPKKKRTPKIPKMDAKPKTKKTKNTNA